LDEEGGKVFRNLLGLACLSTISAEHDPGLLERAEMPWGVPATVQINSIMVVGTPICGICRVEVGDQTSFACADGVLFDGHQVNRDLLLDRHYICLEKKELTEENRRRGGNQCVYKPIHSSLAVSSAWSSRTKRP
jgi:hypothetical protein